KIEQRKKEIAAAEPKIREHEEKVNTARQHFLEMAARYRIVEGSPAPEVLEKAKAAGPAGEVTEETKKRMGEYGEAKLEYESGLKVLNLLKETTATLRAGLDEMENASRKRRVEVDRRRAKLPAEGP